MILELFAGAGGATEGIRRALPGCRHVAVEADPHAAAVWRARHGGHGACHEVLLGQRWADTDIPLGGVVELLWSSPPCQRHSRAGKGVGFDGWPVTIDTIRRLLPRFLAIENVVGAPVEEWAAEVRAAGYHAAVWDLDAADYGIPQHRRRLCVVATTGPHALWDSRPPPAPPEPTHGPGRALPWVTMRDALGLPLGVAAEGAGSNPGRGRGPRSGERTERDLTDEPSTTIAASPGGNSLPIITWARDASGEIVYPRGVGRAGSEPGRLDRPSPTVTCAEGKGTRASEGSGWTFNGGPDRASDAAFLATGRRRLTPSECATLQGFPADYPWGNGPKVHRYRMIGNAVCPALSEVVVRRLTSAPEPFSLTRSQP